MGWNDYARCGKTLSLFFPYHEFRATMRVKTGKTIALHRGTFCQFPFRWYCHSSKSPGKEACKTHLCALPGFCKNVALAYVAARSCLSKIYCGVSEWSLIIAPHKVAKHCLRGKCVSGIDCIQDISSQISFTLSAVSSMCSRFSLSIQMVRVTSNQKLKQTVLELKFQWNTSGVQCNAIVSNWNSCSNQYD